MKKPAAIDPRADHILTLLTGKQEASEIVLGGYFALQHYLDYRRTHDIDAWWKTRAVSSTERVIREAMQRVAAEEGCKLEHRLFGETVSLELIKAGRRQFTFQIAVRSVALEEPVTSAWPPILIETITDNIASKMNALVDRGAPRDFTDIQRLADEGLVTTDVAWNLWTRKNPGSPAEPAKTKVLLHLTALESRRPLESISDDTERKRVRETREWFKREFLKHDP
jgi:hypothetical protein